MSPQELLEHYDTGRLWASAPGGEAGFDVAAAYQSALAVRRLREQRGEVPRGYKIGFTNRTIWERYQVFAPIWGTVWDSTLQLSEGSGTVPLNSICQPRLEPEVVFGLRATPPQSATLDQLFDCIAWVAPGFEIVQSHLPDWKFSAADTVADGGLHARLLVGRQVPIGKVAGSARALEQQLCTARVSLCQDGREVEQGQGANVLEGPLHALHHFLQELRQCPGASDLQAGDVVTTGTWTDAWPVQSGQTWTAQFDAPLSRLSVSFG
jgi:2-oxo-3-hexenedioate decarboxylase